MIYKLYSVAHYLHTRNIPFLPTAISKCNRLLFACSIPHTAEIGDNTVLGYAGLGIVIHARAVIGSSCTIGPHVTIGGTSGKYEVPKIGNNVQIGSGAKILGPVQVGDNSIIGANSVVITDIPRNSVAVGAPARVIKQTSPLK